MYVLTSQVITERATFVSSYITFVNKTGTYIDAYECGTNVKTRSDRMWDPLLVYANQSANALDQFFSSERRQTGSYRRIVHSLHI